ncbi:MAG: GAF domain-containing protein [Chloroflexota bacterium]
MTRQADSALYRPQPLNALREIARSLSAAWDLDTTLDLIARKTTEVMQVDSCTIYLLDPDGETLRMRASTGLAKLALGRATLQIGEGMTGFAVARNQPVFSADAQNDPHFKWIEDTEEVRFRSLLAVPLVLQDKPIGALNVQTNSAHQYSESEIQALSLIADLAAGALAKAQLHDQQKRQLDELQTLAQVSEAVTSPQYLDDILDVVTNMAAQTVGAAACAIYMLDDSNRTSARYGPAIDSNRVPALLSAVLEAGHAVRFNDAQTQTRRSSRVAGETLLGVPLSIQDRAIGVLVCQSTRPNAFEGGQETTLLTLANQTALAIENARLVTNAAIVREMHHRIKNNLQTIVMLMQLQLPDAENLDTRQVLLANIHRIHSIAAVHEILSEKGFRLVDVRSVLERIVQMTQIGMSHPQQTIEIAVRGESLLLPSRIATTLCVVVNELVQNSLEHAFVGQPVGQIEVSLGRSPEELIVLVRDDGCGLPDTFEHNLGLEIAGTLVSEDLHGRFELHRLPVGTEACIRFPRLAEELQPLAS